jgi:hypothetical protein
MRTSLMTDRRPAFEESCFIWVFFGGINVALHLALRRKAWMHLEESGQYRQSWASWGIVCTIHEDRIGWHCVYNELG